MARTTKKTPPVPGRTVIYHTQYAMALFYASGRKEEYKKFAFCLSYREDMCALFREVCGDPGTDGVWIAKEERLRPPVWRPLRADVQALLDAAGIADDWAATWNGE